jgi:hypothetical protein
MDAPILPPEMMTRIAYGQGELPQYITLADYFHLRTTIGATSAVLWHYMQQTFRQVVFVITENELVDYPARIQDFAKESAAYLYHLYVQRSFWKFAFTSRKKEFDDRYERTDALRAALELFPELRTLAFSSCEKEPEYSHVINSKFDHLEYIHAPNHLISFGMGAWTPSLTTIDTSLVIYSPTGEFTKVSRPGHLERAFVRAEFPIFQPSSRRDPFNGRGRCVVKKVANTHPPTSTSHQSEQLLVMQNLQMRSYDANGELKWVNASEPPRDKHVEHEKLNNNKIVPIHVMSIGRDFVRHNTQVFTDTAYGVVDSGRKLHFDHPVPVEIKDDQYVWEQLMHILINMTGISFRLEVQRTFSIEQWLLFAARATLSNPQTRLVSPIELSGDSYLSEGYNPFYNSWDKYDQPINPDAYETDVPPITSMKLADITHISKVAIKHGTPGVKFRVWPSAVRFLVEYVTNGKNSSMFSMREPPDRQRLLFLYTML